MKKGTTHISCFLNLDPGPVGRKNTYQVMRYSFCFALHASKIIGVIFKRLFKSVNSIN